MQSVVQDLRFAVRRLIKDRWFTLAAIAALALGIGANSAVFTLVSITLLLVMVAITACLWPAWQATRLNPVAALRYE